MQISKSFLAVCAASLCIAPLSLSAADSEAQIRAREALEKKLNQLQAQDPGATAKPAPAPATPKQAAVEQPVPQKVEPTPEPAVTAPPVEPPVRYVPGPLPRKDSESTAKAREALRQKILELQSQPPVLTPVPERPVAKPAPEPPPTVVVTKVVTTEAPAPQESNPTVSKAEKKKQAAAEAKARKDAERILKSEQEAQRKANKEEAERAKAEAKARERQSAPPPQATAQAPQTEAPAAEQANAAPPPPEAPSPKAPPAAKVHTEYKPYDVPPLPISVQKREQLAEILRKYRADELNPEQYHQERARILAAP